jgi:hypothetical protein
VGLGPAEDEGRVLPLQGRDGGAFSVSFSLPFLLSATREKLMH